MLMDSRIQSNRVDALRISAVIQPITQTPGLDLVGYRAGLFLLGFFGAAAGLFQTDIVEHFRDGVADLTASRFASRKFSASGHSSHFLYRVSLAQGRGASGPSIMRTTGPNIINRGGCASEYPPPLPFLL